MTSHRASAAQRSGPRPLHFHLLSQATSLLSSHIGLAAWKNGSIDWRQPCSAQESQLRRKIRNAESAAFHRALSDEGARRVSEFLKGVVAYRRHPYRRQIAPPPVVWQQGSTCLLDYAPHSAGVPLLVVPSLINRSYILDLTERRSLMRWLAGKGFRPFLVDWGSPAAEESTFGLEDYIAGRLNDMLDRVLGLAGPPVLIGYCMGGMLGVALASLRQDSLRGLILLATPWDFQSSEQRTARQIEAMRPALIDVLAHQRQLPGDLLQILFALPDPAAIERKFRQFGKLRQTSAAARNFVALEDWVNDCVPLAAKVAEESLFGWYGDNLPMKGDWRIAGGCIEPGRITLPALVMIPTRDRIVPVAQARPLAELLPAAELLPVDGGHVGMLLGPRAVSEIYAPIATAIRRMNIRQKRNKAL